MAIQAEMYPENMGLIQQNYGGGRVVGGSQDWMPASENGCGGGLNPLFPQKQQQQQQQQQQQLLFVQQQQQYMMQQHNLQLLLLQQQQQKNHSSPGFVFSATSKSTAKINDYNNNSSSTNIISSLDAQLQKQNQEIDTYLNLQNERLKLALQQQRKQQLASLLRKVETKAKVLLGQKDEEIAKATKRRAELEVFMRKMEAENQAWRNLALEKEAAALSLHNTLHQLKERSQSSRPNDREAAEDAESCCDDFSNRRGGGGDGNGEEVDDEDDEEGGGRSSSSSSRGRKRMKMVCCKACNSGNLCVLFLPCRHLSSCKACEAVLDRCPVCQSEKKGTIEALLS